ncbi:hypothetical protein D1872_272800 [compost metagenome]
MPDSLIRLITDQPIIVYLLHKTLVVLLALFLPLLICRLMRGQNRALHVRVFLSERQHRLTCPQIHSILARGNYPFQPFFNERNKLAHDRLLDVGNSLMLLIENIQFMGAIPGYEQIFHSNACHQPSIQPL